MLTVSYVFSHNQPVDVFTKSLSKQHFSSLWFKIDVSNGSAISWGHTRKEESHQQSFVESPFWRIDFGSFQFILLYNWLYKTCTMIQWICEKFRPKTLQAYINQLWQGKLWTNEAGLSTVFVYILFSALSHFKHCTNYDEVSYVCNGS